MLIGNIIESEKMPPKKDHRQIAQEKLDKFWGVRAENAQTANAFGYHPKRSKTTVLKLLIKKRKTTTRNQEINQILRKVGLTAHRSRHIDLKTARKLVKDATHIFGEHPQLISSGKCITILGIHAQMLTDLIKSGVLTSVQFEFGSMPTIHYLDISTLSRELQTPELAKFLMTQVANKGRSTKAMRQKTIEKIQQKAKTLLTK